MLSRFIALAIAEEVAARRNVAVVAGCGFNKRSRFDCGIEVILYPSSGKELSQRDPGPSYIAHGAALEETQTRLDEYAIRVCAAAKIRLAKTPIARRIGFLRISQSIAEHQRPSYIASPSASDVGKQQQGVVVCKGSTKERSTRDLVSIALHQPHSIPLRIRVHHLIQKRISILNRLRQVAIFPKWIVVMIEVQISQSRLNQPYDCR